MRKRLCLVGVGAAMAVASMSAGSASAATIVGNGCAANGAAGAFTTFSLASDPSDPYPHAVTSNGVITSWSVRNSFSEDPATQELKVFRPTGVAKQVTVVGESAPEPIALGPNTFPTRIPVQAGDLLGLSGSFFNTETGEAIQGTLFCEGTLPGDLIGAVPGNPGIGTVSTIAIERAELASPVTVTVEPDADGDGYGDETQDQCPTDASTQGPCPTKTTTPPPAPPAPITLSASATSKKGVITVTLTSSAQATVTVGGTAKLAKGKTAKVSGGTQIVAPGSLAKFTILLPAKVTAALKKTPSSKKLTISLTASAPGATSKALTVKVPGQMKPRHVPHRD